MKPIIEVKNLSKRYKLGVFNAKTLREEAEAFLARFARKGDRRSEMGDRGQAGAAGDGRSEIRDRGQSSNSQLLSPSAQSADFWALRDVSFDVQPGEVIGVIGRNGAGKSTLLKILSRITEPTSGEARIRGRVASLLEVGTGFHPELTGREPEGLKARRQTGRRPARKGEAAGLVSQNIFLNGAILGMSNS